MNVEEKIPKKENSTSVKVYKPKSEDEVVKVPECTYGLDDKSNIKYSTICSCSGKSFTPICDACLETCHFPIECQECGVVCEVPGHINHERLYIIKGVYDCGCGKKKHNCQEKYERPQKKCYDSNLYQDAHPGVYEYEDANGTQHLFCQNCWERDECTKDIVPSDSSIKETYVKRDIRPDEACTCTRHQATNIVGLIMEFSKAFQDGRNKNIKNLNVNTLINDKEYKQFGSDTLMSKLLKYIRDIREEAEKKENSKEDKAKKEEEMKNRNFKLFTDYKLHQILEAISSCEYITDNPNSTISFDDIFTMDFESYGLIYKEDAPTALNEHNNNNSWINPGRRDNRTPGRSREDPLANYVKKDPENNKVFLEEKVARAEMMNMLRLEMSKDNEANKHDLLSYFENKMLFAELIYKLFFESTLLKFTNMRINIYTVLNMNVYQRYVYLMKAIEFYKYSIDSVEGENRKKIFTKKDVENIESILGGMKTLAEGIMSVIADLILHKDKFTLNDVAPTMQLYNKLIKNFIKTVTLQEKDRQKYFSNLEDIMKMEFVENQSNSKKNSIGEDSIVKSVFYTLLYKNDDQVIKEIQKAAKDNKYNSEDDVKFCFNDLENELICNVFMQILDFKKQPASSPRKIKNLVKFDLYSAKILELMAGKSDFYTKNIRNMKYLQNNKLDGGDENNFFKTIGKDITDYNKVIAGVKSNLKKDKDGEIFNYFCTFSSSLNSYNTKYFHQKMAYKEYIKNVKLLFIKFKEYLSTKMVSIPLEKKYYTIEQKDLGSTVFAQNSERIKEAIKYTNFFQVANGFLYIFAENKRFKISSKDAQNGNEISEDPLNNSSDTDVIATLIYFLFSIFRMDPQNLTLISTLDPRNMVISFLECEKYFYFFLNMMMDAYFGRVYNDYEFDNYNYYTILVSELINLVDFTKINMCPERNRPPKTEKEQQNEADLMRNLTILSNCYKLCRKPLRVLSSNHSMLFSLIQHMLDKTHDIKQDTTFIAYLKNHLKEDKTELNEVDEYEIRESLLKNYYQFLNDLLTTDLNYFDVVSDCHYFFDPKFIRQEILSKKYVEHKSTMLRISSENSNLGSESYKDKPLPIFLELTIREFYHQIRFNFSTKINDAIELFPYSRPSLIETPVEVEGEEATTVPNPKKRKTFDHDYFTSDKHFGDDGEDVNEHNHDSHRGHAHGQNHNNLNQEHPHRHSHEHSHPVTEEVQTNENLLSEAVEDNGEMPIDYLNNLNLKADYLIRVMGLAHLEVFFKEVTSEVSSLIQRRILLLRYYEHVYVRPVYNIVNQYLLKRIKLNGQESYRIYSLVFNFLKVSYYFYDFIEKTDSIRDKLEDIRIFNGLDLFDLENLYVRFSLKQTQDLYEDIIKLSNEIKYFNIEEIIRIYRKHLLKILIIDEIKHDIDKIHLVKENKVYQLMKILLGQLEQIPQETHVVTDVLKTYTHSLNAKASERALIKAIYTSQNEHFNDLALNLYKYLIGKITSSISIKDIYRKTRINNNVITSSPLDFSRIKIEYLYIFTIFNSLMYYDYTTSQKLFYKILKDEKDEELRLQGTPLADGDKIQEVVLDNTEENLENVENDNNDRPVDETKNNKLKLKEGTVTFFKLIKIITLYSMHGGIINECLKCYTIENICSSNMLTLNLVQESTKFLQNLCEGHNNFFQDLFFNLDVLVSDQVRSLMPSLPKLPFVNFIIENLLIIKKHSHLNSTKVFYKNRSFKDFSKFQSLYQSLSDMIVEMIQGANPENYEYLFRPKSIKGQNSKARRLTNDDASKALNAGTSEEKPKLKFLPQNSIISQKSIVSDYSASKGLTQNRVGEGEFYLAYLDNIIDDILKLFKNGEADNKPEIESDTLLIKTLLFKLLNNMIIDDDDKNRNYISTLSEKLKAEVIMKSITYHWTKLCQKFKVNDDTSDGQHKYEKMAKVYKNDKELGNMQEFKLAVEMFLYILITADKFDFPECIKIKSYAARLGKSDKNNNKEKKTKRTKVVSDDKGPGASTLDPYLEKINSAAFFNHLIRQTDFVIKKEKDPYYNDDYMLENSTPIVTYSNSTYDKNDNVTTVYFVVHPKNYLLDDKNILSFFEVVDRSTPTSKLKGFIEEIDMFYAEVMYKFDNNAKLDKWKWTKDFSYSYVDMFNFAISIIINIILLIFINDASFTDHWAYSIVLVIAGLQILTNLFFLYIFFKTKYEYSVVIEQARRGNQKKWSWRDELEIKVYRSIFHEEIYLLYFNIIVPLLCILSKEALILFPLGLFSVLKFIPTIKELVDAFIMKFTELIAMVGFLAILILVYANMGFLFLPSEFVMNLEDVKYILILGNKRECLWKLA